MWESSSTEELAYLKGVCDAETPLVVGSTPTFPSLRRRLTILYSGRDFNGGSLCLYAEMADVVKVNGSRPLL